LDKARALIDETIALGGSIKGLSFHVGSQCTDTEAYDAMLEEARLIWDYCLSRGCKMEVLDIGGGFPAPYRQPTMHLHHFATEVYAHIEKHFGDTGARYIAEPGRGLSARCATLITKILGKNERNNEDWYFIDEGLFSTFSGKVFDQMEFQMLHERNETAELETCVVAGPTCDSSDIISNHEHLLPCDMESGDLLLVPTMGAYTRVTAAAQFNGLEPAKVVVIE
jgi:ornithine decarboxylase